MIKRILSFIGLLSLTVSLYALNPAQQLLERIDKGASRKFQVELVQSPVDFFELDQSGKKVVVRGNTYVNIATGVNWYLKYYTGVHLSWNGMQAKLPDTLPEVPHRERHETAQTFRYDFNFCTFSYSMAFWDWERWEKEIDWMALHGINMSLALTGTEVVWKNVLTRLGYTKDEVNQFVAGPAFTAWWLMNNLEGWGGPTPDSWYMQQEQLQKKIVSRMKELGIAPILPGYCGMVPHNAAEKLGLNVKDPGTWCSYTRPAFLQPEDTRFQEIASIYYEELTKLYGVSNYYAMDPFHEGGNTQGVNLDAAGKSVMAAMKKANPKAVWVIQGWQENPLPQMIENLNKGDLLVLDLFSECTPHWGNPAYPNYRSGGYGKHEWLYCMLLNYGANTGLHGRMDELINGYYDAKEQSQTLRGVGMTPEGIENNPVMFELLMELPWRSERFTKEAWLQDYVKARYGTDHPLVQQAWTLLAQGIYNCPKGTIQQGTTESVFCARPSLTAIQASSWADSKEYYTPESVMQAAALMRQAAPDFIGNNNFEYDLTDICRQANAEKGRYLLKSIAGAWHAGEQLLFRQLYQRFLHLMLEQDELLARRPEFRLDTWVNMARKRGTTPEEKALYAWNARTQITTWGNRTAADKGGLHDYAHKEWSGLLMTLYYPRWEHYFLYLDHHFGQDCPPLDFFPMEEEWTRAF